MRLATTCCRLTVVSLHQGITSILWHSCLLLVLRLDVPSVSITSYVLSVPVPPITLWIQSPLPHACVTLSTISSLLLFLSRLVFAFRAITLLLITLANPCPNAPIHQEVVWIVAQHLPIQCVSIVIRPITSSTIQLIFFAYVIQAFILMELLAPHVQLMTPHARDVPALISVCPVLLTLHWLQDNVNASLSIIRSIVILVRSVLLVVWLVPQWELVQFVILPITLLW